MSDRLAGGLELLLPEASEEELGEARRWVTLARLLRDDARARSAARVTLDADRVRRESEEDERVLAVRAGEELLRRALDAALGGESCLDLGPSELTAEEAWQVLLTKDRRGRRRVSCGPPGESALQAAERLLGELRGDLLDEARAALWTARCLRASAGPERAERAFRELSAAAGAEALAGRVACLLDRGAVRRARELLERDAAAVRSDPVLRRLARWTACAAGDADAAARHAAGPPWLGQLPRPLAELREARPDLARFLTGKAADTEPRSSAPVAALKGLGRKAVGASVWRLVRLSSRGAVEPVQCELAPGLGTPEEREWSERDGLQDAQHEVITAARRVVRRGRAGAPPAGALGRATRVLALEPLLDDDGEVQGWLHIELEHELLPSRARLTRLAEALRPALARGAREAPAAGGHGASLVREGPADGDSACRGVFEDFVRALGWKLGVRRWWGFVVDERAGTRFVAQGGEGLGPLAPPFRARSLERALRCGGRVSFDEPQPELSLHPRSGSGLALALRFGGRTTGAWIVESQRRRDFRPGDGARLQDLADEYALDLEAARFRDAHREALGHEVWVDPRLERSRRLCSELLRAARSRAPVLIAGPPGGGKRTLARWIAHERTGELELEAVEGARLDRDGLRRLLKLAASASGRAVLLRGVEGLAADLQERLFAALEEDAGELGGLVASTRAGLEQAVAAGDLSGELARTLDRLPLSIPPLRERREEVVPLVRFLLARFAREEEAPRPELEEDALALLWRQPWEGNLRELEGVAYRIVVHCAGRRVDAECVRGLTGSFPKEWLGRLPSRHPARADVVAALRSTRLQGGRCNKVRAASYLGWDPDTLAARMKDLKIDSAGV